MTPPRLGTWLLDRFLDPEAAEAIGGDLAEAFERRVAGGQSVLRAQASFCRQVMVAVAWHYRRRLRRPAHSSGRRSMFDALWTETRQTVRALRHAPGFSFGAIVPLALAVALATAIFAVVHAALLRPLPVARPDRLVAVSDSRSRTSAQISNVGYETFVDFREQASSFDGFAAVRGWGPTLTSPSTTLLRGLRVTAGYFSMLGVRPALGRDFTAADDTQQTRRVVILSDALWRREFAGDAAIVNRLIKLNEVEYRVIGVLPPAYEDVVSAALFAPAEIWAPLGYERGGDSACRSCRHLRAIASIKPGVTVAAARQELQGLLVSYKRQYPRDYETDVAEVERLSSVIAHPIRRSLYVLFVAVLLVLTIAAANAASLMLARATDQEHERAIRAALGASSRHLIRQRAIEALLIAGCAGIVGLAAGQALTSWLLTHTPTTIPRAEHIGINGSVVLFTVAAVMVTAAIIAVLPALSGTLQPASRAALTPGRTTDTRPRVRGREGLIVADVAIALMLAVGAGAMVRSVDRLLKVDPGFDSTDVHSLALSLVGPRWAEDGPVRAFQRDLLARVRALPGIREAALAGQIPLGGNYDMRGGYLEERQTDRAEDGVDFQRYSISPGYLRLMSIPLKRGRGITDEDREQTTRVMVINETAARTFWPGQDPIGRRVRFGSATAPYFVTVVGVTGDVRHYQLDQPPDPQMYMPQEQMTDSFLVLLLKTDGFDGVLPAVRDAVRGLAPDVPIYDIRSVDALVDDSAAPRRFTAELLGIFAIAAVIMTAAGLYGLVSYAVSRRTREFGIRIALGAPKNSIRGLVIARGLLLTSAGGALGLLGSMPLSRLLRDQLYETSALDGAAITAGLIVLLATSVVAHAVPVSRATRVSPTIALR